MKKIIKLLLNLIYYVFLLILFYLIIIKLKPVGISIAIAYILYPVVRKLKTRGVNEKIASLFIVALFVIAITLILLYILPIMIKESIDLMSNIGNLTREFEKLLNLLRTNNMPSYIKNLINHTLIRVEDVSSKYIKIFFDDMFNIISDIPIYILIPIFVYYFLSDVEYFKKTLKAFIPYKNRERVIELFRDYDKIIGAFIKGQLILSLIISIATLIALMLLKVKYAFIIAFLNGLTNIIPYFGPVLGYIPALLAALTDSTTKAIYVTIAFFLIQQFESAIIAPKILENAMGLHPVFVIIALLIGGKFFGTWGLILSVPIFAILKVTYNYIVNKLY